MSGLHSLHSSLGTDQDSVSKKKKKMEPAQWLTSVIPAFWEAGVGRSQGQEFETSLAIMVKSHLY